MKEATYRHEHAEGQHDKTGNHTGCNRSTVQSQSTVAKDQSLAAAVISHLDGRVYAEGV
jgi:hypothetical protein